MELLDFLKQHGHKLKHPDDCDKETGKIIKKGKVYGKGMTQSELIDNGYPKEQLKKAAKSGIVLSTYVSPRGGWEMFYYLEVNDES